MPARVKFQGLPPPQCRFTRRTDFFHVILSSGSPHEETRLRFDPQAQRGATPSAADLSGAGRPLSGAFTRLHPRAQPDLPRS